MLIAVATWPTTPPVLVRRFDQAAGEYGPGHRGVDLAAALGDPVRAAMAGKVAFVGAVAGTPVVTIEHADGVRTTYEPVASRLRPGMSVAEGDVIGEVAPGAGHCGGVPACLHWGLIAPGGYLDPAGLFGSPVLLPLEPNPAPTVASAGRGSSPLTPVAAALLAGILTLFAWRRR